MKLEGPDRFKLTFDSKQCAVAHPTGARTFTGRAARAWPKLYVIVSECEPVYVGITQQSMRNRLRLGFSADGSTGYHGYAWRHVLTEASMYVWYSSLEVSAETRRELETIEAEIVFEIRAKRQWPRFQTEIHFYPPTAEHRLIASRILAAATCSP
jgi:hypothetical protein